MTRHAEELTEILPLTAEERERMRGTLEWLWEMQAELLAARGGKLFRPAEEDLAELRGEREAELP